MSDTAMSQGPTGGDPLGQIVKTVKGYVDQSVDAKLDELKREFVEALNVHVEHINALQETVATLVHDGIMAAANSAARELVDEAITDDPNKDVASIAADAEEYRLHVIIEAARLDVKPSELMAAKKELGAVDADRAN